jgi:hypothetical protein
MTNKTFIDKWALVKSISAADSSLSSMLSAKNTEGIIRLDASKYNPVGDTQANYVVFQFDANGSTDDTFKVAIYGGNDGAGYLQKVCDIDLKLINLSGNVYKISSSDVTFKPATITSITEYHTLEVMTTTDTSVIGTVQFDATGFKFLKLVITDVGGGSQPDNVCAYMRAF